jgi:flagellar biosynthesis/type III secretory pathway protein FliH
MVEGAGVRSGGAAAARSAPSGRDGELSTGDAGDAPGTEAPPAIDEGPAVDTAAAATAAAAAAAAALEAATAAATAAREAAEIEAERLAEVRAAFEVEVERARAFAEALEAAQSKLVREIRGEVAQIVLAAARAIAGEALHADPLLLDAMVSTAVEAFGRDGLVVRVAPADAPGVRLRHPELEVREDATLEAGMVATGPAGSLDASFGRATTAIEDALARWREGA